MSAAGLDLSLTETGYAFPNVVGHLKTPANKVRGMPRLALIRDTVAQLIEIDRPALAVIEGFSFGSKGAAVFQLGGLGYIIRLLLHDAGVPALDIPPSTLKIYATGHGHADKKRVIDSARRLLGYEGKNDNEADALWLRALGMELTGEPLVALPDSHRRALEGIENVLQHQP